MKYIGLGYHKNYDHATMIDTETGEIKSKRLAHTVEEFQEFIGGKAGTRAVMESCWNWSWRNTRGKGRRLALAKRSQGLIKVTRQDTPDNRHTFYRIVGQQSLPSVTG